MYNQRYSLISNPQVLYRKDSSMTSQRLTQLLNKLKDSEELLLSDSHNFTSAELSDLFDSDLVINVKVLRINCCLGADNEFLKRLARSSSLQKLQTLDFARCRWFTNEGLEKVFDSAIARQITELNLSKCDCVTNETLKLMANSTSLQFLEVLSLEKCYELTSQGIIKFVTSNNASNIKSLNLMGCWRVKDDALEEISDSERLKKLENLNMSGLNYITHEGIKHLVFSDNLKNLKALNLSGCYLLDDTSMKCIAESKVLSNLKDLNLNYNSKITSLGIERLCDSPYLISLEGLSIKEVYLSIRGDKSMAMSDRLSNLKRFSFDSERIHHFMSSYNTDNIEQLHFGPCKEFPEDMPLPYDQESKGFKKIFIEKDFPFSLNLPIFQNLNVFCVSLPNLTDEVLHLMLSNSRKSSLKVIKLVNLENVTESGIKQLLSSTELMANVKSLELRNLKNLTNQCLKAFSKNKKAKLTELSIKGNFDVTGEQKVDDLGVSYLVLSPVCTNLKILELRNLGLNESILKYIAASDDMSNLEELLLDKNFQTYRQGMSRDQHHAFKFFFGPESKLKKLRVLSFKDCPNLTYRALVELYRAQENVLTFSELESIKVDFTDHLHPDLIKQVTKTPPTLTFSPNLTLKNISNKERKEYFDQLFDFCSNNFSLIKILFSQVHLLTDVHFTNLVNLNNFNFVRTMVLEDLRGIDGSFMASWALPEMQNKFKYLQKLRLINLPGFKSDGLETFVTKANLEALSKLEIRKCPLIGDEFLKALSNSPTIKKLYRFVLADLKKVNDAGICTFVQSSIASNLRIIILEELQNLHAEVLSAISRSNSLPLLMSLKIINCRQIDSSKTTFIFDSPNLHSLSYFSFDNPILPNDNFLKSFVFTKLKNLVSFKLNFTGDFPRDGILDLLGSPDAHFKHIVLSSLVGNNLESIANDDLIELLIKSGFIDVCLSLNTRDNSEVHKKSVEKLLNFAQSLEFSLGKFVKNYGHLVDDDLLYRMREWNLEEEDYYRQKILVNRKASGNGDRSGNNTPGSKSRGSFLRNFEDSFATRVSFPLRMQDNLEIEAQNTPTNSAQKNEQFSKKKFINFLSQFPDNFNFRDFENVTPQGISKALPFFSPDLDIVTFMNNHQEILTDEMFGALTRKTSFQLVKSLPLEKYKLLTSESQRFIFESNNRFFFAKMFDSTKSQKFKLNTGLLSIAAKSKEFSNVKVIKTSKFNTEMNCFDGLKEVILSQHNQSVVKLSLLDVYAVEASFESLYDASTLQNLEAITIKGPANKSYAKGLEKFIYSPKFLQIKRVHIHNVPLSSKLIKALKNSQYCENIEQLYFNECTNSDLLSELPLVKNLKNLTEFKLSNAFFPPEFFENLINSPLPIESLILRQIKMSKGNVDILELVSQIKNSKIKRLIIDAVKINTKVIDAMCKGSAFTNLEFLILSSKQLNKLQHQQTMARDKKKKPSRKFIAKKGSQQIPLNEDFPIQDFKKLMTSDVLKNLKHLKLFYQNMTDEWINIIAESSKLGNLITLEFHPDCKITAFGMGAIVIAQRDKLKSLVLPSFLETNSKMIDNTFLTLLQSSKKLHLLNNLNLKTEKVTSDGLVSLVHRLNLKDDPNFKLSTFLYNFNQKVNDDLIETLSSSTRFLDVLKELDMSRFPNVQEKCKLKLKIILLESEEEINKFLKEAPQVVDDEFIELICKSPAFNQKDGQDESKVVNIRLDPILHTKVTSAGLNMLIEKMCQKKFTVFHDWILLEDHWRNLINIDTIRLLADDRICKSDSLDLVIELDFDDNYYISTNGYQHLMRKEIKAFQHTQDLRNKDTYLLIDTEEFLKGLNKNRFIPERTKIDDEVGNLFLKIIAKCKYLKEINLKNKNFDDGFAKNLSILLSTHLLEFLEVINLSDNPRITSRGLKYLYTAIVGKESIKIIQLRCNPDLQPEINTIVEDGLYVFTKKKLITMRDQSLKNLGAIWCLIMSFYMVIVMPFALWQCYEDKILKSRTFAWIKEKMNAIIHRFLNDEKKNNLSILPISDSLLPQLSLKIQHRARKLLKDNNRLEVPAENFYFTKKAIALNQFLGKSNSFYRICVLNFIVYYTICILVPVMANSNDCEDGMKSYGFAIYGGYAILIFAFETVFFSFMVKTLHDKRALKFGWLQCLQLLTSQTAKFDLFTDVIFVVNTYSCGLRGLTVASGTLLFVSVIVNMSIAIVLFIKYFTDKEVHNSSHINHFAKLSLSLELHAIGTALDRFSTSNSVKMGDVYFPQIMLTTISKFILEDLPQFIFQLIKLFAYSKNQGNIWLSLVSTIFSLFSSFVTAMRARPSICKPQHVEQLVETLERQMGETNLQMDKDIDPEGNLENQKQKTRTKSLENDEENPLVNDLNSGLDEQDSESENDEPKSKGNQSQESIQSETIP